MARRARRPPECFDHGSEVRGARGRRAQLAVALMVAAAVVVAVYAAVNGKQVRVKSEAALPSHG